MAGVVPKEVDYFAISRDPRANLLRKALFTLRKRPSPGLVWDRLKNSTRVRDVASIHGKIRERTPFEEVYVQPAAADNGMTLGAIFYVWHQMLRRPRRFIMEYGSWGSEFSEAELREALGVRSAELDRRSLN
jgi:hypothetical protein